MIATFRKPVFFTLGKYEIMRHTQEILDFLKSNSHWSGDRQVDDLQIAMERSLGIYVAVSDDIGKSDELGVVGFGRIVGDGYHVAMLTDICIDSQFRGRGVGKQLVEKLIALPEIKEGCRIHAMTSFAKDFYLSMGFKDWHGSNMVRFKG